MKSKPVLFVVIALALFGGLYPSYASGGLIHALVHSDIERFISYVRSLGPGSAVVFVLVVVLEVVLAPIPALVLYVAGGLLYGGFWGGTLTLFGNTLGAMVAFWLARYFARDWVRSRVDPRSFGAFNEFAAKYGVWSLVLLRINPTTSTDLFSYLAGLSDMRPSRAVLGTVLGLAPLVYVQTYLGADLVAKVPFFGFVFLWLSAAYFVLFTLGLIVTWRRWRKLPAIVKEAAEVEAEVEGA